jgi:DNA-directed RNA polymerase specialized sigma subunit
MAAVPVSLRSVAKLAATGRQEQDLAAWHTWKKSPTDANASALLAQVSPLIHKEASKWAGTLARPLLETEGKRLAMQAFHSYDPNKGAALGTHVVNQLQRMSRLSYANQNVARLPENKMLLYHAYNVAHSELADEHGRHPTTDELSDRLGWPIKRVEEYRKAIGRREMLESGGLFESSTAGLYDDDKQDHLVDFVHHDLAPMHKAIFEHLTGYRGVEVLSNQDIQKKLGMTQGQYSYAKKQLVDHLAKVQEGRR